jgi:hypothetical protein
MHVDDALTNRGAEMRCPECHGRMRVHKEGTTGQGAHFEHQQSHVGCSFSAKWDGKSRSRHPLAIRPDLK